MHADTQIASPTRRPQFLQFQLNISNAFLIHQAANAIERIRKDANAIERIRMQTKAPERKITHAKADKCKRKPTKVQQRQLNCR